MSISRRNLLAASPLLLAPATLLRAAETDSDSSFSFEELTEKSERSVRKGTDWLMKTMHRDGGCGVDIGQPSDIGCTAMVGLALMGLPDGLDRTRNDRRD